MKYLLINRHAKSPWNNFNISDHDRELNSQGVNDALSMGKRLLAKGISFNLIVTSSATRALTTSQLIASEINYPLDEIRVEKGIYGANSDDLKDMIHEIDNDVDSLAMFGHNPALHMLSEDLMGEKIRKFPTCSMSYFELKTDDWKKINKCDSKMLFFDHPNNG